MNLFFATPAWLIDAILFLATLASMEFGYRIGLRYRDSAEELEGPIGVVQSAVLGLMAFLLGLTFSFTAGRFEERHTLEQKEANALGTALSRTQLVVRPQGKEIAALLPEYASARLAFYQSGLTDPEAMQKAKTRCDEVQGQIWRLNTLLFAADKADQRTVLLTNALNEAFDAGSDVEESRRHTVPVVIYLLLFLAVLLSGGFIGYSFGRVDARTTPVWLIFTSVAAVTIFVILDLDRPERGLIRNEHGPLLAFKQSVK